MSLLCHRVPIHVRLTYANFAKSCLVSHSDNAGLFQACTLTILVFLKRFEVHCCTYYELSGKREPLSNCMLSCSRTYKDVKTHAVFSSCFHL